MRSAFLAVLALLAPPIMFGAVQVVPGDGASLQRAIDAHPGQQVFVPAGDYVIDQPLRLKADQSGLWGPGRIIQSNPEADIVNVENVSGVVLRDLTFTRSEGKMETHRPGLRLVRCADVTIDNVQILDNRGDLAAIFAAYCRNLHIKYSYIENYSRIAIDDRTAIPFLGYAFNCINGTGMLIRHSAGTRIEYNRVIELRMLPTPELKAKYNLGKFSKKNPVRGASVSEEMWAAEYFNGWHQGAAIQITKGETSDFVQLLGNYVENAAQGIDIHGDHVIMSHNTINNAFIGMKAMHGSRNVIIAGNQFSRNDLWSIQLQPGTASHVAIPESAASKADPADPEALTWPITRAGANIDGHSIVANNIISDFGYGTAHWMWDSANTAPIQFNAGPLGGPNGKPPPETDVIVTGNVLHDTGRDGVIVDGQVRKEPPRYRYAVRIGTGELGPRGLRFSNNILHPGTDGVSNVELTP